MAIIAIIIFLLAGGSGQTAHEISGTADKSQVQIKRESPPPEQQQAKHTELSRTDDSLKTKKTGAEEIGSDESGNISYVFADWTRQRIEGYSIFDLDATELSHLGITVLPDGTIRRPLFANSGVMSELRQMSDSTVRYTIPIDKISDIKYDSSGVAHIRVQADDVAFTRGMTRAEQKYAAPVLITNSRGYTYEHRRIQEKDGSGEDPVSDGRPMVPARSLADTLVGSGEYGVDDLIPIRVRPDVSPVRGEGDFFYLLWFEPTDAFLAQLPRNVRHRIQRQRDQGISPGRTIAARGAEKVPTIAASVHPNPITQSTVTVQYTLNEPGRVAVSMYDVTGERVRELAVTEQREKGTWQQSISLDGMVGGLYLLAVATDRGVQSVQPVILKR
ncbi:MAG: T9SS type A sorting domain-containing protein [Bacteroidota bacterium]|nr:T9SS type A sorting domain-containing protein [Bacteroidota bacterium]